MLFESSLSGVRQSLATESPLEIIKNVFYFTSKALFVLKIFKFFVLTFWLCSKSLLNRVGGVGSCVAWVA